MASIVFRQIPAGLRLLAIGDFIRDKAVDDEWRVEAFFTKNSLPSSRRLPISLSCVLGVGREFNQEDHSLYKSNGFKCSFSLPPLSGWEDRPLESCPRLSKQLRVIPRLHGQRCFVFETNGITVWLPKFELARFLFFRSAFVTRTAFSPNGLDMAFMIYDEEDGFHIHTPEKTGAPANLINVKGHRDHLSWLLLDPDVRSSFESIWRNSNSEKAYVAPNSTLCHWKFNFTPPVCLSGATIDVSGSFDRDRKAMLIWDIHTLGGIKFCTDRDVFFHHPSFRSPSKGQGGSVMPSGPPPESIDVDAEQDPKESTEATLIQLTSEGVTFTTNPKTKIVPKGQRHHPRGKLVDNRKLRGQGSQTLGVADPVMDGSVLPGEFSTLEAEPNHPQHIERFATLVEIIKDLERERAVELLRLVIKPLPAVSRCTFHMIDEKTPRLLLMGHFRLTDGSERFLFEIDTSDKKKPLSTRIVGFWQNDSARKYIDQIISETLRGSLRWPATMKDFCEPMHSVNHPKDGPLKVHQVRIAAWKQRLCECLS